MPSGTAECGGKLRVLHVESGMHLYGGALQIVFLLRGLERRGVESLLVCRHGSAIAAAARPYAEVREVAMHSDLDAGLFWRLRREIRAFGPDLVHLHSRRGSEVWGGLAARATHRPVIYSRRNDNPEPRWWAALKYRLYDRVVCISEGIRRVLLAEGVREARLVCVPSAVDTAQYRPGCAEPGWLQREYRLPADAPLVGIVAQFIERKGHALLLDALPAIAAAEPRVRVLMFGRGPLQRALEARVRGDALLARHVVFGGFRDDLPRVLPCLDLLVHPASMEGLGVSLLQAAACGVPIVGGRAGGIPEVVRPGLNGELVEPGDAAALARHAIELLATPGRRAEYGAAGRRWVQERFSVEAMVQGNLAAYRDVLARRRAR